MVFASKFTLVYHCRYTKYYYWAQFLSAEYLWKRWVPPPISSTSVQVVMGKGLFSAYKKRLGFDCTIVAAMLTFLTTVYNRKTKAICYC